VTLRVVTVRIIVITGMINVRYCTVVL